MDNSAIINLEAVASDDSDYEMDFSTDPLSGQHFSISSATAQVVPFSSLEKGGGEC